MPFVGGRDSRLACLAESPGEQEVIAEEPLVGRSGYAFNTALGIARIPREKVLIGNTILCRPPFAYEGNKIWEAAIAHCGRAHVRPVLDEATPEVVILMGGAALLAFTGMRPFTRHAHGRSIPYNGIEAVRGSAYRASEILPPSPAIGLPKWGGGNPWLIPSLHPAYILRGNQHLKPLLAQDFDKAVRIIGGTGDFGGPKMADFELDAKAADVVYGLMGADAFAYDVETDEEDKVTMIGLGRQQDRKVWVTGLGEALRAFLATSLAEKGGHNIAFDLKAIGSPVAPPWFDTIIAAALVQPAMPKSLADCASIYGYDDYWYWKDLPYNPRTQQVARARLGLNDTFGNWERLYNALDVWWTMVVRKALLRGMRTYRLSELFRDTQMALLPELLKLERIGMPVDLEVARSLKAKAKWEVRRLEREVKGIVVARTVGRVMLAKRTLDAVNQQAAGAIAAVKAALGCPQHHEYNGRTKRSKCPTCFRLWEALRPLMGDLTTATRKAQAAVIRAGEFNSGSAKDWKWLLYAPKDQGGFGFTSRVKTKNKDVSSGKDAVRGMLALANLHDDARTVLRARLRIGQLESRIGKFLSPTIAADGRMHPSYSMYTALNGRFNSGIDETDADKPTSEYPINAQNFPEDCRRIVVAPAGRRFTSMDYAQIEAWTSAMAVWKTIGSRAYWDLLSTPGVDIHTMTAELIGKILGHPIIRFQGKRIRHLWTYGGTKAVMAKILAGDGVTFEIARAGEKALEQMHPDIVEYKRVRIVNISRSLFDRNPFGRICFFTVGKRGSELTVDDPNVPLAWLPASTAHDIAKRAWLRLAKVLTNWPGCWIINHMHDSWLFETPDWDERQQGCFVADVRGALEFPVHELRTWTPDGESFVPRVDVTSGYNWGEFDEKNPQVNPNGLREWVAGGSAIEAAPSAGIFG